MLNPTEVSSAEALPVLILASTTHVPSSWVGWRTQHESDCAHLMPPSPAAPHAPKSTPLSTR